MTLFLCITCWFFFLLLMGLRPDAVYAAESWPDQPEDALARSNKLIVSACTFVSVLLLWFLTAFRSSAIGNDTANYLMLFRMYSAGFDRTLNIELGYQALNYLIGIFTRDPHAFLIIIATLMYGGFALCLFKYCHNTAVTLCLFYCLFFSVFASIFRQGIAMVIALYGYQLLKHGKKAPAALVFLLATAFHTTAILCFLLFLDLEILEKRWFVYGLTALCVIVSLSGVLRVIVDAFVPKYSHYFDGKYASSGWMAITFYLLLYLLWYELINRSLIVGHRPDRLVSANFTLLLMLTAFGYAVNLFERAGEYFLLIAITELPNMLFRGKVKNYRLWILGFSTVMLVVFVLILRYRPGWNHLYPYEFWH